jgi:hypothetical protein
MKRFKLIISTEDKVTEASTGMEVRLNKISDYYTQNIIGKFKDIKDPEPRVARRLFKELNLIDRVMSKNPHNEFEERLDGELGIMINTIEDGGYESMSVGSSSLTNVTYKLVDYSLIK